MDLIDSPDSPRRLPLSAGSIQAKRAHASAPPPAARSGRREGARARGILPVAGLLSWLVIAGLSAPALAGRVVRHDSLRLRSFELPRGWVASTQNGYPKILALASGPEDARLLVGGQRVTPGTTALTLAADARAVLIKQGFTDVRVAPEPELPGGAERARLDAGYQGGKRTLRQYYVVDVDVALVFTVTMDAARARGMRDVELAVGAVQLSPLDTPEVSEPPAGVVAPADGGAR